jgi:CTP:molybdopterin cytidylyltransferase MocA
MIAGVVLAAGRSARLGQPKQLLPYRGRPLLEWALAAMAASRVEVTVVVLGHDAERVRRDVDLHGARVVYNERYAEGLSTSLQAGLAALGPEVQAAVVAVGDQPLLGPDTIDALIAAHAATGAPIVAADYSDHQGTPLLLDRSVWPLTQQIRGDQGARALLRAHPDVVVTVPVTPATAADVDTWDDYERLRQGE